MTKVIPDLLEARSLGEQPARTGVTQTVRASVLYLDV
jgi:hypothetical protein